VRGERESRRRGGGARGCGEGARASVEDRGCGEGEVREAAAAGHGGKSGQLDGVRRKKRAPNPFSPVRPYIYTQDDF